MSQASWGVFLFYSCCLLTTYAKSKDASSSHLLNHDLHDLSSAKRAQDFCDVSSHSRTDCYSEPGATEAKCHSRGCCWRPPSDQAHDVPWCFFSSGATTGQCALTNKQRSDCHPENGATPSRCFSRGCCWQASTIQGVSWCYHPSGAGYNIQQTLNNGNTAILHRKTPTHWPNDLSTLKIDVTPESSNRLHFKIYDPNNSRYEVPIPMNPATGSTSSQDYTYRLNSDPFGVVITRKSTGSVLFDSTMAPMVYSDQFIQLSIGIPTGYIYGLGERRGRFRIDPSSSPRLTFWARDDVPHTNANLYGVHPFFLGVESDGNAFGVFLLNSNAMEVDLFATTPVTLRYRTIGGVLDFYMLTGPTPDDIIDQYWNLIGKPPLPPYWSLGYHLSRWGYGGGTGLASTIRRMRDNNIPWDAQWGDIDYMQDRLDWTYDHQSFSNLPAVVKDLHDHGQKFVIIVDPGISNTQGSGSYSSYDDGLTDDVFIKTSDGSAPLIGEVWPGRTVYPDFTHPKAEAWWQRHATELHNSIPYDGLWIDMNEPSNFKDGSVTGCPAGPLDHPPYTPAITGNSLIQKTICASAVQHLSTHYNLHNLYGHFEGNATYSMLKNMFGKRPFILSRSTFAGSGKYVAHWEGDNLASWEDMEYSIPEILSFNMFGIPFVGVDICGFRSQTTEELCTRWMQLATFYPFMRTHQEKNGQNQDPAAHMFSSSARDRMRKTLQLRYRLLPFLYTLFSEQKSVVRPLLFQYPHDSATYNIDKQFLWGKELLISPVLQRGQTSVQAYFPQDTWYDFHNGKKMTSTGQTVTLDAPMDTINVHIRGGSIVPTQEPDINTKRSRNNDFGLVVAVDSRDFAEGMLYWDDGESLNPSYNKIKFTLGGNQLRSSILSQTYQTTMTLGSITVYGVQSAPAAVRVNGMEMPNTFDSTNKVLHITRLHVNLLQSMIVTWS